MSCPAHNCSFGRTWETYRQPYYFLHADRPYLYFSWLVAHDPFECMQFAHDLARLSRDLVSRPFIFNDYDYYYHVLMAYISHKNLEICHCSSWYSLLLPRIFFFLFLLSCLSAFYFPILVHHLFQINYPSGSNNYDSGSSSSVGDTCSTSSSSIEILYIDVFPYKGDPFWYMR